MLHAVGNLASSAGALRLPPTVFLLPVLLEPAPRILPSAAAGGLALDGRESIPKQGPAAVASPCRRGRQARPCTSAFGIASQPHPSSASIPTFKGPGDDQ